MAHHDNAEMEACIEACLACYRTCLAMATTHCLEMGGAHVARPHFTLMLACAEICRTAAHFMLMASPHHRQLCAECAAICAACAEDCARLGDMQDCVEACRRCAEHCRRMAA